MIWIAIVIGLAVILALIYFAARPGPDDPPNPARPRGITGEPHSFRPLRPWDLRSGGRCQHCYLPMHAHPVHYDAPVRGYGDMRKAELNIAALSGKGLH
jgi:hypothetical protein